MDALTWAVRSSQRGNRPGLAPERTGDRQWRGLFLD